MILDLKKLGMKRAVEKCAAALVEKGAVALVPTETVYGLVCKLSDKAAQDRIYALKRRADSKPLASFYPDVDSVLRDLGPLPPKAEKAARAFCPGPITIVAPDGKGSTLGFRIPDHPFVLALLKKLDCPLASTSANLSGQPAALSVDEALKSVLGEPEACVDGGAIEKGSKASTVVVFDGKGSWKIVRPGPISQEELAKAIE